MFAQQAEGGRGFLQQDAEECWSTLINMLSQRLMLPIAAEVLHPPLQPIPSPSRTHVSDTYLSTKEIDPRYTGQESSEPAPLAQPSDLGTGQPALLPGMSALRRNLGDMLFGVEMECNYKCTETEAEPAHSARESVRESRRNCSCKLSTRVGGGRSLRIPARERRCARSRATSRTRRRTCTRRSSRRSRRRSRSRRNYLAAR